MNARPLAVMDSLRFGPISAEESPEIPPELIHKNHSIMEGVVSGIAGYGNCFGVPNLGGETRFEPCYSGNPLVNAFALGLVRLDEIFYAKATGIGNPVIYVGAKTGRDGIHGATMASEEFKEGSEQKRPNVQMGDPFMEKLLLEACLEAMKTGAVLGIQDMGAAGLTCSTCEMGARGGVGVEIELDHIPQRETGMSSYEIMLSESQERMLLVAEKGRGKEVLDVFSKWGLDATIAGQVIAENRMRVWQHGELVADIPNESLTDDAPLYHRPVGTWKAPVPLDPPAEVLAELSKPRDYTADLKKLLASSNILLQALGLRAIRLDGANEYRPRARQRSRSHADQGYWHPRPRTRPRHGPRRKQPQRISTTPRSDAIHAVAESPGGPQSRLHGSLLQSPCHQLLSTTVTPKNRRSWRNSLPPSTETRRGPALCRHRELSITESMSRSTTRPRARGFIRPPAIWGSLGFLTLLTKAVWNRSFLAGDQLLLLMDAGGSADHTALQEFGSSEYAKLIVGALWGSPPYMNSWALSVEAELHRRLAVIAKEGLITAAIDISDGLAVSLAEGCFAHETGVEVNLVGYPTEAPYVHLFSEECHGRVIVACALENVEKVCSIFGSGSPNIWKLGSVTDGSFRITIPVSEETDPYRFKKIGEVAQIDTHISELKSAWSTTLPSLLTEVHA